MELRKTSNKPILNSQYIEELNQIEKEQGIKFNSIKELKKYLDNL